MNERMIAFGMRELILTEVNPCLKGREVGRASTSITTTIIITTSITSSIINIKIVIKLLKVISKA